MHRVLGVSAVVAVTAWGAGGCSEPAPARSPVVVPAAEAAVRHTEACPARRVQAAGPQLRRARSATRPGWCLWKVGSLVDRRERTEVFLTPASETGLALVFERNGEVEVLDVPDNTDAVEIVGSQIEVRGQWGRDVILWPIGAPPARATINGRGRRFDSIYAGVSRADYERALSQPPGSRRDGTCARQFSGLPVAPERVRRGLAGQRALEPELLDGANCLWKAGVARADGGRTYGLYLHSWEGGVDHRHWGNSLLVLEGDRTLVGWYPGVPVVPMRVRDGELVIQGPLSTDRISFRGGPPRQVLVDGHIQEFLPRNVASR